MTLDCNCYYHGLIYKGYDPQNIEEKFELSFKVLEQIIKTRAILSRKRQNIRGEHRYNSDNEICLCKDMRSFMYLYDGRGSIESGYLEFVTNNFSIIINQYLKTKRPKILSEEEILDRWYETAGNIRPGKYSNMYDEYRTKNKIESDRFIGIGVPYYYNYMTYFKDNLNDYWQDMYIYYFYRIQNLLNANNINIPIFDTETKEIISSVDGKYFNEIQNLSLSLKK